MTGEERTEDVLFGRFRGFVDLEEDDDARDGDCNGDQAEGEDAKDPGFLGWCEVQTPYLFGRRLVGG